jgi:hypothetical protein
MVIEVLIVFMAWVVLGGAIKYLFAVPWYAAVPAALGLLILYDLIVSEGENRRR